jgi:predicted nucleic-acid-binding protein
MIGVDTNVLLRIYIDDPSAPQQVEAARRVIEQADGPVWLSLVVLLETIWVMRRRFGAGRAAIVALIRDVLDRPIFVLQERASLEAALDLYMGRKLGFADCLIEAKAIAVGVKTTFTFDLDAAGYPHFTLLETDT